ILLVGRASHAERVAHRSVSNGASALADSDTLVSVGSAPTQWPQNLQAEPAIALDAHNPMVLAAGANDFLDFGPSHYCSNLCTPGVGFSGIYFSLDGGATWVQPTYQGWSNRTNVADVGPIGTLPWYYEKGLTTEGDPSLAFGPRRGADGKFSWANGSRLYYANLAFNFSEVASDEEFGGLSAVAVSRTDNPAQAAANDKNAWLPPVIVNDRFSAATFDDKDSLWVDNAAASPYFGNVYVSWSQLRSDGPASPRPILFSRSTNGG